MTAENRRGRTLETCFYSGLIWLACVCWCVQESFSAAKLAYRQFKLRTWKRLSPNHFGPESLEDASVDYIVRNLDLYDVKASVNVGLNLSLV